MTRTEGAAPHGAAPRPSALRMLGRGLLRRCPNCGARDLFQSWFAMRPRCPACGLRLDRGETDFWIGAWMLNVVGVLVAFTALLALGVTLLWPDVPWDAVLWIAVAGMIALPLLLFPVSRTLWLAIDLVLQPQRPSDFAPERSAEHRRLP